MSIKLLNVIEKTHSKYEIQFERDGKSKVILITENCHWVEDIHDYISTITCENQEFYEIWADFGFRKSVSQAIKELKAAELQAA